MHKLNIWGNGILRDGYGRKITLAKVRSLEQKNILPLQLLDINRINIVPRSSEHIKSIDGIPTGQARNAHDALTNLIHTLDRSKLDDSFLSPVRTYLQENLHKYKKGSSWWVKSLKSNQTSLKGVRKREEK